MWYICTPAYRSLGTSVSRFGVITSELLVFSSGPPCARCSVGYLCLLKLVFNRYYNFGPSAQIASRFSLGIPKHKLCRRKEILDKFSEVLSSTNTSYYNDAKKVKRFCIYKKTHNNKNITR